VGRQIAARQERVDKGEPGGRTVVLGASAWGGEAGAGREQ
jgi:hypothetical protein